jgi:hypothetical protein
MKKNYFISFALLFTLLMSTSLKAQNWTVGTPVDMSISYLTKYGFGCAPGSPDFSMNIILNNVSGIQYIAIVDSVVDIAVIYNTTDTLMLGDTLNLSGGNNNYSVSFVNGNGNISFNFKAVGTPTTAGENHPCAFNDLWMSNLLLCNEGLTRNVQNTCTVDAATSLNSITKSHIGIQFPNASNQYQLQLSGLEAQSAINLYDITGKAIKNIGQTNNASINIPCQELNAGIYFINFVQNGTSTTSKFIINK